MRYQSDHKEQTRQRVLKEAAAAIRTCGPDGVGVAGVMSKVGLTHGAFYAHFESKDDLVAQALSLMFEEAAYKFMNRTENADPAVALGNYIDMYLSARHRDAPESGCPLPSLSGELARASGEARARFTSGVKGLTSSIAGRIQQLGEADPQRLAASMVAEMVGALALSRAVADPEESQRILRASRDSLKARLAIRPGNDAQPPKGA